ncbi:MAG: hypothetical protein M5U18_04380 [Dehalococcoidia bacterium]|nr:hypothetical protein [Dehalococcoidia bacterium]
MGLWLIVTSLPWAQRRPDLAFELRRLSAQGRMEIEAERQRAAPPTFVSPMLERTLRPLLDDAGQLVGRLLSRLGIRTADLEQRLAVGWPGMTPQQFFGQKLAAGLLFVGIFPALNLAGLQPFGPWPAWVWLGAGVLGFIQPDWLLKQRVARRRQQLLMELPTVLDLLAMATSAGLSPEQAILDVSRQIHGVLGEGLRTVARRGRAGNRHSRGGTSRARLP